MNTPMLALLALLIAQSAASPRLVVPDAPDVMIKTRRTIDRPDAAVTTEVIYLKGARQRREVSVEDPWQAGTGSGAYRTSAWIQISQCDERRTLLLNQEVSTYAYEPIEDPAAYIDRLRAARRQAPSREMTIGPTVTVTIDAVDTGERRRFGHYVARHVITTRTVEPGPGATARTSVDRQDGWYIEAPPANCTEWGGAVTSSVGFAPRGAPRDRVELKQRDTARRGYPIEETNRIGGQRDATVTKIELIALSEAPLDAALFTVPTDYRPALPRPYGGYDLTKPDTMMNRVESYREVVVSWADYVLRYGLRGILPGTRPPARY